MKIKFLALTFLLILSACAQARPVVAVTGIEVYAPSVTAAKVGEVAGAFMTIKNTSAETDRLLGATCEAAGATQVHETVIENDVMKMREVAAIEIPAGEMVELRHGSYHIMLLDLKQDLVAGQTLTVTLKFEQAGEVTVPILVMKP